MRELDTMAYSLGAAIGFTHAHFRDLMCEARFSNEVSHEGANSHPKRRANDSDS
jgi:hypothetical protein